MSDVVVGAAAENFLVVEAAVEERFQRKMKVYNILK